MGKILFFEDHEGNTQSLYDILEIVTYDDEASRKFVVHFSSWEDFMAKNDSSEKLRATFNGVTGVLLDEDYRHADGSKVNGKAIYDALLELAPNLKGKFMGTSQHEFTQDYLVEAGERYIGKFNDIPELVTMLEKEYLEFSREVTIENGAEDRIA